MRYVRVRFCVIAFGFAALGCDGQVAPPPPTSGAVEEGESCTQPGGSTTAEDDCTRCTCNADYTWSCDRSACPPPCTPGESKDADDDCNSCVCASDGTWNCTDLDCLPRAHACAQGAKKAAQGGCGTCTCTPRGIWSCPDAPCDDVCADGSVMAAGDGCNTCSCEEGEWQCTELDCPKPACPDDAATEDCVGDELYGRAHGTDACCLVCPSAEGFTWYESLAHCEASKVCTPGDEKYADDECNTCQCDQNGHFACSNADCAPIYCDGPYGSTCSESEYCAFVPGMLRCDDSMGEHYAVCRPRPPECTGEESPVCACGELDYESECAAAMAGVGTNDRGACRTD
jgi:hypothetical protein